MGLSRYALDDLSRFLEALDEALDGPTRLTVIGGSALVLGFGGTAATSDIDTYESQPDRIEESAEAARAKTGLAIPINDSTIAQLPHGFEQRLTRVLPNLKKLEIYVLDRYDLAASKLLRGNEHDRQQLAQLHQLAPLELPTLLACFRELMADFVGSPDEPWWALRHFIEETWGELAAGEIDEEIRRMRRDT